MSSSAGPIDARDRLELRQIDELALARAPSMPQCDQRCERARVSPAHVGVRIAVARRRPVGLRHQLRVSRERLQRRPVADVARARAGVAEAGHADANNVGLHRLETFVIHPPGAHHARRKIIHHDVANRGQPAREFDAFRMLHVERDRKFAAMQVALQAELAIAHRRRILALDLDHLRAVVAENPRRDRPGHDPGEIEDAHAVQRHRAHDQITPSAASTAIASGAIASSSRKISPVCSPTSGGRRDTRHGVPLKRYGAPG